MYCADCSQLGIISVGDAVRVGTGIFGGGDSKPGGCVTAGPQQHFRETLANVRRELAVVRARPERLRELLASPDWNNQLNLLRALQAPAARGGAPGSEEAFDCPSLGVEAAEVLREYARIQNAPGGPAVGVSKQDSGINGGATQTVALAGLAGFPALLVVGSIVVGTMMFGRRRGR